MGQLPPCLIRHCSHVKNAPARDLASLAGEPSLFAASAAAKLERLQAGLAPLAGRYDAVVANPPYMGAKNMNAWLGGWVKKRYPDVKGDLFSCFMVRNSRMGAEHAQLGFMTPYVWMFIGTYEKLREFVVKKNTITSLTQLEYSGFSGATVPICAFTLQKGLCPGYKGGYIRLSDFVGADQQGPRALQALADPDCGWFYRADARGFGVIPGSPIAYWVGQGMLSAFRNGESIVGFSDYTGSQNKTGDNNRFLRMCWEVSTSGIGRNKTWAFYSKGGDFRRWYGNLNCVVRTRQDDFDFYAHNPGSNLLMKKYWFEPGITYTMLTSGKPNFRSYPNIGGFDMAGPTICGLGQRQDWCLAFLNTSIAASMLDAINPTLNLQVKDIKALPFIFEEGRTSRVNEIVDCNVSFSRSDWDDQETSWDFKRNPLV